jgi:hypothetical protein
MSIKSFRVKCRTATKFVCDSESVINVQTFGPLRVLPVEEVFGQNYLDIRSYDNGTTEEAQREASRVAEMLLLAGAKRGFGARLEGGALSFSDEISQNFKASTGKKSYTRSDRHHHL